MAELVGLIGNAILLGIHTADLISKVNAKDKAEKEAAASRRDRSLPSLTATAACPRAILVESSSASFGRACERAVNISLQTSQTFPSMMGNCADVLDYLRQELAKLYADEHFHIIISENDSFGFSVDAGEHFAEIKYGRYQTLIFSTKRNPNVKLDTHDANSRMILKWK